VTVSETSRSRSPSTAPTRCAGSLTSRPSTLRAYPAMSRRGRVSNPPSIRRFGSRTRRLTLRTGTLPGWSCKSIAEPKALTWTANLGAVRRIAPQHAAGQLLLRAVPQLRPRGSPAVSGPIRQPFGGAVGLQLLGRAPGSVPRRRHDVLYLLGRAALGPGTDSPRGDPRGDDQRRLQEGARLRLVLSPPSSTRSSVT